MLQKDETMMRLLRLTIISAIVLLALLLSACASSIRASEVARHNLGIAGAPVTLVDVSDFR